MNASKPDIVPLTEKLNNITKRESTVSTIANKLFETQNKTIHKSVSVDFSRWRAVVTGRVRKVVEKTREINGKPPDCMSIKEDSAKEKISIETGNPSIQPKCTCNQSRSFFPREELRMPSELVVDNLCDDCCCLDTPDVVWSSSPRRDSNGFYENAGSPCEESSEYQGQESSGAYDEVPVTDDEKLTSGNSPDLAEKEIELQAEEEQPFLEESSKSVPPLAFTVDFGSDSKSGLGIGDPLSRFVPRHKRAQSQSSKDSVTPPRSSTPQTIGKQIGKSVSRNNNLRNKLHSLNQDGGYLTSETEEENSMTIQSRSPMLKRRDINLANQKGKASSSPPTRERLLNLKERSPSPPTQKTIRKITPSPQITRKAPQRKDQIIEKVSEEKKTVNRKGQNKQPIIEPPDISSSEVENDYNAGDVSEDKVSESGTYTIDVDSPEVEKSRKDIDRVFNVKGTDSSDCSPDCEDGLKTSRWVSDWAAKTALQNTNVSGKPPLDPRGSVRERTRTTSRDVSPVKSSRQSSVSSSPLPSPHLARKVSNERVWSPDNDSFEEEKPRRRLPVIPAKGRSSDGDSPTGNKHSSFPRSTSVDARTTRRQTERQLSNESRRTKPTYDSFIDDVSFERISTVEKKNNVNSAKYDVKTARQTSYIIESKNEAQDNDDSRSVASSCSSSDAGYKNIISNIIQKSESKPLSRLDRLSKPPARMLTKSQPQPPPAVSSSFSRNDGGRYSLKAPQSKPYMPSQAVNKTKPRPQSGNESRRSNSTLNNKETEFQNWKRRKSYDPLKAAREGSKKKTAVRSSTVMSQSLIQETTIENEEPPENLHRSSSLTCFEDPPPLITKRTTVDEDSQSLWDYRDIASSPRLQRKAVESPRLRSRPLTDTFGSDKNVVSDRRSLVLEDQSMRTKQLEVLDNLVIATIHNLSGKIRGQADNLLKKLRSQFLDDPARSQALDAVLYRLNEPETPPTASAVRTTSRDLASTLKILKRIDQVFQVLDDTLFEEIEEDDMRGDI
ncbi:serine/arginine repetitive matrix protein 2-like isoform X2 [Artemia franciscana]|uniref:serine/arginine repetitive matrix protein 2-like isoform X2 n=1 Tax=Artemia franciscana TaxID=6661 RepID=UPI0032DBCC70